LLDNCRAFPGSFRLKGLLTEIVIARGNFEDTEIEPVFPKKPLSNKRNNFHAKGLTKLAAFGMTFQARCFLPWLILCLHSLITGKERNGSASTMLYEVFPMT